MREVCDFFLPVGAELGIHLFLFKFMHGDFLYFKAMPRRDKADLEEL